MAPRIDNVRQLENLIRKAQSSPQQESAAADLEAPVSDFAATKAGTATAAEDAAARLALAHKEIEMKNTQTEKSLALSDEALALQKTEADRKLSLAKDYLDWWGKQNTWASIIGAGALGVNIAGIEEQKKKQETRDAAVLELGKNYNDLATRVTDFSTDQLEKFRLRQALNKDLNTFNYYRPGQASYNLRDVAPKALFLKPEMLFQ